MKPKATHLSESMRAGKQLAHITIELSLEDLPGMIDGLDLEGLNETQLLSSLASAEDLRRRLDDEAAASAVAQPMPAPLPPADEAEGDEE